MKQSLGRVTEKTDGKGAMAGLASTMLKRKGMNQDEEALRAAIAAMKAATEADGRGGGGGECGSSGHGASDVSSSATKAASEPIDNLGMKAMCGSCATRPARTGIATAERGEIRAMVIGL